MAALAPAAQGCHLESLRSTYGPVTVGGPGEFRVTPAGWYEGGREMGTQHHSSTEVLTHWYAWEWELLGGLWF